MMNGLLRAMYSSRGGREEHTATAAHIHHRIYEVRYLGGYDWATSRAGRWMTSNAWKYGFVLSYPKNMASQVCYGYEPWHYRYYGRAIAAAIHYSGLTARYWLWGHGSNQ